MSTFYLRIATPERDVFTGTVDYVSLNTPQGRAGFLAHALPRVAVLSEGAVEITVNDEKMELYCLDGIFSIDNHGITVITAECNDVAERDMLQSGAGSNKYAKARIASNLIKMKGSKFPEETF